MSYILYSHKKTVMLNSNNISLFLLYFWSNKCSLGKQKRLLNGIEQCKRELADFTVHLFWVRVWFIKEHKCEQTLALLLETDNKTWFNLAAKDIPGKFVALVQGLHNLINSSVAVSKCFYSILSSSSSRRCWMFNITAQRGDAAVTQSREWFRKYL